MKNSLSENLEYFFNLSSKWTFDNINNFMPPDELDFIEIESGKIKPCPKRKAFGELGIAISLYNKFDSKRSCLEINNITQQWVQWVNSKNIFFDLEHRLHLFPLSLVNAWSLKNLSKLPDDLIFRLQTVFNFRFIERTELSLWAKVDLAHYADALNLTHSFPSNIEVLNNSSVSNPPSLTHISRHDAYGLTHIIFHTTSFGNKKQALKNEFSCDLESYLRLLFFLYLNEDDYDICLEIIASLLCMDCETDDLLTCFFEKSYEIVDSIGYMPARKREEESAINSKKDDEFINIYHPNLVFLIMHSIYENRKFRM